MGGKSLASTLLVVSLVFFAVGFGMLFSSDSSITGAAIGMPIDSGLGVIEEPASEESSEPDVELEPSLESADFQESMGEEIEEEEASGSSEIAAIDGGEELSGATSSCGALSTDTTLSGNVVASGDCFIIGASHIVVDGAGYSITGDESGMAFWINGYDNVTIKNVASIYNFSYGIRTQDIVFGLNITNVSFDYVGTTGAHAAILFQRTNHTIIDNTTFNQITSIGVDLKNSVNVTVSNSHMKDVSSNFIRTDANSANALIKNNYLNGSFGSGLNVQSQNLLAENNDFDGIGFTISSSNGGIYFNNNLSTLGGAMILDNAFNRDVFVYNNSFGQLLWNDTNYNVGGSADLRFGDELIIENESIIFSYAGSALDEFNTSAELMFYGLGYSSVELLKDGVRCDTDDSLCNISYDSGTGILYANVSDLANFTVQDAPFTCSTISEDTTLTDDLTAEGDCIIIGADHVVLNGAGYSITGNGSDIGVKNVGYDNVTITNLSLDNFSVPIELDQATQINVSNVTLAGHGDSYIRIMSLNVSSFESLTSYGPYIYFEGMTIEDLNFSNTSFYTTNKGFSIDVCERCYSFGFVSQNSNDSITFDGGSFVLNESQFQSNQKGIVVNTLNDEIHLINPLFEDMDVKNIEDGESSNSKVIEFVNGSGRLFWNRTEFDLNPVNITFSEDITLDPIEIEVLSAVLTEDSDLNSSAYLEFYGQSYNSIPYFAIDDERCDLSSDCNVSYTVGQSVVYVNTSYAGDMEVLQNLAPSIKAPTNTNFLFNMSSNSNLSLDNFSCYVTGSDDYSSSFTLFYDLYKNGVSYYGSVQESSVANDTEFVFNVSEEDVLQDENWICSVMFGDGEINGTWVNSSAITTNACGTLERSYTFTENITASGDCFTVGSNTFSFDLNGNTVWGDGSGFAFRIDSKNGVTIKGGTIDGFTQGFNLTNANSGNLTNLTIQNNSVGIFMDNFLASSIETNIIQNNSVGINASNSGTNFFVNNLFNNTLNAESSAPNFWNTTYSCSDSAENIIGGNCSGGNFWSDYSGNDNGNGSVYPSNISQDKIGDNSLPWNSSTQITVGGDYLPLVYACVESWTCGSWTTCSSSSQSRTCTDANNCGTISSRPALTQSCSSGGGGGGGSSSDSSDSSDESSSSEESSSESSEGSESSDVSSDSEESSEPVDSSSDSDVVSDVSSETSDDGGVEIPAPSEDVYASVEEISGVLSVEKAVVTDSNPTTTDSTSTEGISSTEGSSSGNLAGFAGSTGTDSTVSKPAPAKVNDVATAKEAAKTAKKKVSINLANDGTKKVQLKPQVRVGSEDSKLIVTRKTYKLGAADSGISVSKTPVTGDLLRASLTNTKLVEINPGEKVDIDIEVAAGFSTKNQIPVKVELLSYDGVVYEEEILIDQEPALASAVVPHVTDNTLDLYAMIVDKSDLIFVEDTGNSLTGAAVSDLVFDNFVSKEDYYLEVTVIKDNEGVLNTIPIVNWFIPNQKVVFAELYGPYPIESQEGFVFAQQFSYDPEKYDAGDYIVQMRIMQGLHELSLQEFEVYLE